MESKAQRAKAPAKPVAKTSAPAIKVVESSPTAAAQTAKSSSGESPSQAPSNVIPMWKWGAIGLGVAATIAVVAGVTMSHSGNSSDKPEGQVAAEKSPAPPVKNEVAANVPLANPVEEKKPTPAPATNSAPVAAVQPAPTNPAPVLIAKAVPAAPKSALDKLKLQGIFYSTQTPKALINGTLATIDEEVEKCRVLDISPSSATLEYLNQRRTLTLK
jgi:hypothetical protein